MVELRPDTRVHFVGIGGVGMSALAELLHIRGCVVKGTDRQASELTDRLGRLGVVVQIGHSAEAVGDADCVVYTPAAGEDNPEVQIARAQGIPVLKRADLLGVLTQGQRVVGVSGTHGKTTTTAMVGAVLEAAGEDPTVLVGGVVQGMERNLQVGSGTWWVVEADEFDRSFLKLIPSAAVVTTLEADHLDCYGDLESVQEAFDQFVGSIPDDGFAVLCGDFEAIQDLGAGRDFERIFYGLDEGVHVRAVEVERDGFGSRFRVRNGDRDLGSLRLRVPGLHNVSNALAAVAVGNRLGVPWEAIRLGLEGFRGVHRRFEILGEAGGVTVVNDYAHHPTEVAATLATAREGWGGRIVGVFQPHLYTRTRDFADAFGVALCGADQVWTTEIYAAREAPIPGVNGKLVLNRVREAGGADAQFASTLDGLRDALMDAMHPGDLLVVMGAGDVERVAFEVLDGLQARGDQADRDEGFVSKLSPGESLVRALRDRCRGELRENESLARHTTFGVGGPADLFFLPADVEDLAVAVPLIRDARLPVLPLGGGTNMLVRDAGFRGLVVCLTGGATHIEMLPEEGVAQAGAGLQVFSRRCQRAGRTGMEFGCGIPGTVGGAIWGNAGAWGGETMDNLIWLRGVDLKSGEEVERKKAEIVYRYRHTDLPDGLLVIEAGFRLEEGDPKDILEQMDRMLLERKASQPLSNRSSGCMFKNPPGTSAGLLIDEAGGKGLSVGPVGVSEVHANFVVNQGGASASDVLALVAQVRDRVRQASGVELEMEVRVVGEGGFESH